MTSLKSGRLVWDLSELYFMPSGMRGRWNAKPEKNVAFLFTWLDHDGISWSPNLVHCIMIFSYKDEKSAQRDCEDFICRLGWVK